MVENRLLNLQPFTYSHFRFLIIGDVTKRIFTFVKSSGTCNVTVFHDNEVVEMATGERLLEP
jgi:hypothetical protein